jgi:Tfp pilus assembly protein PilN
MLAGGSANLPYLKEFLEEKLNLPVEFFNPLQRISAGKGVDVDALASEAHTLGELVGLGIRAAEKAAVSIDLVPEAVQAQRDITRRKPALIAAAALFLAGLGAWAFFKQTSIAAANKHLKGLESEAVELQAPAAKIKTVLKKELESKQLIDSYAATENGRLSLVNLLNDISSHFASDQVWLTELEPRSGYNPTGDERSKGIIDESFTSLVNGKSPIKKDAADANCVLIKGLYRKDQQDVYALLKELRNSEHLKFTWTGGGRRPKETNLTDDQIMKIEAAIDDGEGKYAAPFEMLIPLKTPISVK